MRVDSKRALSTLAPALLAFNLGARDHSDARWHPVGAIVGAAVTLGRIATWHGPSFQPRRDVWAGKIAMAFGVAAMALLRIVPSHGEDAAIARPMTPDALALRSMEKLPPRSADLIVRYPADSRSALGREAALPWTGRPDTAESILRETMTPKRPARPYTAPHARERAQEVLALVLAVKRRFAEVFTLASHICDEPRQAESRAMRVQSKLCKV